MRSPVQHFHDTHPWLQSTLPVNHTDSRTPSYVFYRAAESMASGIWPASEELRVVRWLSKMLQLEQFVEREGRLPRENRRLARDKITEEERSLADWMRYQRRPASVQRHSEYQTLRLQHLPGFKWEPKEQHWDGVLQSFSRFVLQHGRAPRYRTDDRCEKSLAAWAAKQRYAMRAGKLSSARVEKLAGLSFRILPPKSSR
jgi:hypothetical protein